MTATQAMIRREVGAEAEETERRERLLAREWLLTNGLGGYAAGSLAGACTRRYHGLLIAALPAPLGRVVMLNHLFEEIRLPGGACYRLGGEELSEGSPELYDLPALLSSFELEDGMPIWRYRVADIELERRVILPHLQNTVHVTYRLVSGAGPVRLRVRPSVHFRPHEEPVSGEVPHPYALTALAVGYEVRGNPDLPPLRLRIAGTGGALVHDGGRTQSVFYRLEKARGYAATGVLWSPGYLRVDLAAGSPAALVGSTEDWDTLLALAPDDALAYEVTRRHALVERAHPAARSGIGAELVLAADQFIILPASRTADTARARAAGASDDARTIIAGYHWFTDWGRDTMISLHGLTLCTGRAREGGWILKTFARHVRDGLIPNFFLEGQTEGLYHTADATLWFFQALSRYLQATGDRALLKLLLPVLLDIMDHHLRGTHFGIGVDPEDGLLRQGEPGYQLTWMDAKVGDWVVTPRRGKAVEINALWYNALRLLEGWVAEERSPAEARPIGEQAQRARDSFNRRFWNPARGFLFDVVDGEEGDDAKLRPNQIFAMALPHAVLDPIHFAAVLAAVERTLLTPVGLRSLAPGEPGYSERYDGDLQARDAAYHQGTVWGWLIGPFVDAWRKVHPDGDARRFVAGFVPHLTEACIGSVSEVFDAEPPFSPRGCVAQAWSVAEVLRIWCETAPPE